MPAQIKDCLESKLVACLYRNLYKISTRFDIRDVESIFAYFGWVLIYSIADESCQIEHFDGEYTFDL